MSDERIDSYIDREGVKRDTAYMLESLNAVYDGFKKVESVKLDLKGLTGLSGIAPGMQQAKDAAAVLAEATATVQERIAQLNGHSKEYTQVLLAQVKAQKEAAQTTLIEAKAETEKAKAKAASEKSVRAEQKAVADATNEYKKLSAAYNEAAAKAKSYAAALGTTNPLTVQATKDAVVLGTRLKEIDASVGQFGRNVGNYAEGVERGSSKMVAGINKIWSVVRQAAYILPGIGIAGIFSLVGEGIASLVQKVVSLSQTFNEGKERAKAYAEGLKDINEAAIKGSAADTTKLELIQTILTDVTKTQKERGEALKAYNDIADKSNQIDASQIDNLTLVNDKIGAQIGLIEQRAMARAAEAVLGKRAEDLFLARETARTNAEQEWTAELNAGLIVMDQRYAKQTYWGELEKRGHIERAIAADKEVKAAQIAFDETKKSALALIGLQGFSADDKSGGGKSKVEDATERRRKAIFDAAKIEQEIIADANKAIYTDETQTHAARIIALTNYTEAKNRIITLETDFEKGKKGVLAEELVAIDKDKNKKVEAQARETATELEKINKQIFGYVEQGTAEQEQVYDKFYKDLTERYKQYLKEKNKLDAEQKRKEEEEAALKKKFTDDLIKSSIELGKTLLEAGLERQKNAIQDQITALEAQKQKDIEVANQSLANAQDRAAAITVIEARAAAQKEQLQKKQRDLDVKKAEFEKAAAIASIIQQTAQNLVKAFPNPALIALASALGAVQLATVIAQPIPKYKHGKGAHDNYEGPAIVGDGGKHEAIIREDGTVEITDNKPQLTFVKSGDIVAPDARKLVAQQMARASASITGQMPVFVSDNTALEIRDMKNAVVGAIKKIPQPQIEVSNVIRRRIRFGDNTNTYLNSNLQG